MKVLAFGDSFVKMFLHCQPQVKHWKFKGKSVKGLVKEEDLDRKRIERQVRKTPSGTKILMFFGQVDFNYVRYYKIIKGEPPITEDTFKKYVQWVSSMNQRKNISIVSIFPTPIKKQSVISSLINKGSYLQQEQTEEIDNKILTEFEESPATWETWNSWIGAFCQEYNVNNIKLFKQNHLEPEFYDISRLTIHLRYVPVLKLVKNYVDITFDPAKAQQIQKQYEREKVDRITNSIFRLNTKDEQDPSNDHLSLPSQQATQIPLVCDLNEHLDQKADSLDLKGAPQQAIVKTERKYTADLDTDTNLEKENDKCKQTRNKVYRQKQASVPNVSEEVGTDESKKKKGPKKPKKDKEKDKQKQRPKEKKKYVSAPKNEESEDQGEIFLQLAARGKKKY